MYCSSLMMVYLIRHMSVDLSVQFKYTDNRNLALRSACDFPDAPGWASSCFAFGEVDGRLGPLWGDFALPLGRSGGPRWRWGRKGCCASPKAQRPGRPGLGRSAIWRSFCTIDAQTRYDGSIYFKLGPLQLGLPGASLFHFRGEHLIFSLGGNRLRNIPITGRLLPSAALALPVAFGEVHPTGGRRNGPRLRPIGVKGWGGPKRRKQSRAVGRVAARMPICGQQIFFEFYKHFDFSSNFDIIRKILLQRRLRHSTRADQLGLPKA